MTNNQFTVKELKAIVNSSNAGWVVEPSLADDELIPLHSTGAVPPPGLQKANEMAPIDISRVINTVTANPFLYERRKAMGLIKGYDMYKSHLTNSMMKPEFLSAVVSAGLSNSVDWRSRWGWNWISLPKDQDGTSNCWIFGATGVVESMARIDHCAWSIRSEGDVRDGMGKHAGDGGWPDQALNWMIGNGVADPGCYPFYDSDHAYTPTADRSGRTVKIYAQNSLAAASDQKTWLDTVGPITMCFEVFHDFDGYGGGVYKKSNDPSNYSRGWHCVLCVGYDETNQCWICKNSWGEGWGESYNGVKGYFRIGYGEASCDVYAKFGVQVTNTDPLTKRNLHNGNLFESGNGNAHRNFELLVKTGNSLKHCWRDGSSFAWATATTFANDVASNPTLRGTTFNRNFECVYLTTSSRLHHWWLDQNTGNWNDGGVFGPVDAAGIPSFIQSSYGAPGNFEVVVRTADGKLNHWWRDGSGWHDGGRFASGMALSGSTLVQSKYGTTGNFEMVAVNTNNQMQHFWRDNDNGDVWNAGVCFGANVNSSPVMIQGQYAAVNENSNGNFEMCVVVNGIVQHWWRDNYGGTGWHMSAAFGSDVNCVTGLIEGSYGFNLEMVVLLNTGQYQHWWRDGAGWHAGPVII